MPASTGDADAASVTAGGLLRHLRRRARLSQFRLAERCGLSDRTIRGLETGAIRTPHQSTLQLIADALELSGGERANFDAAWRAEHGQVWLDSLLAKGRGTDVELSRRLQQQYASIREITHWTRRVIGSRRRAVSLTMRRGFIVERNSVSSWLFAFGRRGDSGHPHVTATENCRFERAHEYGPTAWLLEFAFDRDITAGEAYSFTFDLTHEPDDDQPETVDAMVALAANLPALTLEVQFDREDLPVEIRQVSKPLLDGELSDLGPIELSPFHTAHLVLEHPEPGFYGMGWTWRAD